MVGGGEPSGAGAGTAVGAFPGEQDRWVLGAVVAVAGDEVVEGRGFQSGEAGVPQPGGEIAADGETSELAVPPHQFVPVTQQPYTLLQRERQAFGPVVQEGGEAGRDALAVEH